MAILLTLAGTNSVTPRSGVSCLNGTARVGGLTQKKMKDDDLLSIAKEVRCLVPTPLTVAYIYFVQGCPMDTDPC